MPSRYQYYSRRRGRPGRRLWFDNNVIASPAAMGSRGRMPIYTRFGGRRLGRKGPPLVAGQQPIVPWATSGRMYHSDREEHTKRTRTGTRVNPSQDQSTRQHGDLNADRDEPPAQKALTAPPIRTIQVQSIKWPTQGTAVGERLGSSINVSGFSICEQFHNTNAYAIVVHYAILQPKNAAGSLAQSLIVENFFRDNLGGAGRTRNFVSVQPDTEKPDYDFGYDCLPINVNQYHVLTHQKKVLAARSQPVNWTWDTWKFKNYFNLKGKTFTFDTSLSNQPDNPIYRVFWWQPLQRADWEADDVTGGFPNPPALLPTDLPIIERNHHSCVYFTNALG